MNDLEERLESGGYKPINRSLLVRKCTTGTEEIVDGRKCYTLGGVAIIERRGEFSKWAEIMAVADDCELVGKDQVGGLVFLKEWDPRFIRGVLRDVWFLVREEIFEQGNVPAAVWR